MSEKILLPYFYHLCNSYPAGIREVALYITGGVRSRLLPLVSAILYIPQVASLTEQTAQPSQANKKIEKAPLKAEQNQEKHEVSNVRAMSQKQFCTYLSESAANVSAKAARRRLSIEDYLKTIALEHRGENWEREPGIKGGWSKQI